MWQQSDGNGCKSSLRGEPLSLVFNILSSSVQFDGKRVVSGAYDYLVKVWNPEDGACLHTLQGHTNRVYSLQVGMMSS